MKVLYNWLTEFVKLTATAEELRARLSRLGVERARLFTWEKAVDQTWGIYLDLLAMRGQLR